MKRSIAIACCTMIAVAMAITPASAHVHDRAGRYELTIGWLEEPAFAGFKNGVEVRVEKLPTEDADHGHGADDDDTPGKPVAKAKLKVEVIFEESERIGPLDLEPAFGAPGEYRADLIPTRAGVYAFHITGTIEGKDFDKTYTAGEKSFSVVESPQELEFPAKDPSREQLKQRLEQTERSLVAVKADADGAGTARLLAIIAIVLAAAAAGLALGARKGRA